MSPNAKQQHDHGDIDYTHLESVEKILTRTKVDHKFKMKDEDLQALRKLPGNASCMDCGIADPEWASVNLGIFVCLVCSGHHRAMGTHVSFVRSVDMDSWSELQLQKMYLGGNETCAKFLTKHNVTETSASGDKYDTPAAHLYQKVLSARVKGEPEPTELPEIKKPVRGAKRMEGFGSQVLQEPPNPILEIFRNFNDDSSSMGQPSPKTPQTPSEGNLLDKIGQEWSKFMDSVPDLEATEVDLSERDASFTIEEGDEEKEEEKEEEEDEFCINDIIDQIVEDNDTGFTNSRWSMATKEFKSQKVEKEEQQEEDLFQKIGSWWEKEVLKKNEHEGIQP